jgi:hypothetical protein
LTNFSISCYRVLPLRQNNRDNFVTIDRFVTIDKFFWTNSFKIPPKHNTDGWGNKLVTIFARHLDCFIMTLNLSLIGQIRDFGSGQILKPRQFYLSPGLAKIAPWWLARRDYFLAKVPGLVVGGLRHQRFLLIIRQTPVRFKGYCTRPRHPTRKSKSLADAKHMLFYYPKIIRELIFW